MNAQFGKFLGKFNLACGLAITLLLGSATAQSASGTVTNKTTGKPAAGDVVVLLKLAQGMQELTTSKTDAKGHFTLNIPADEVSSMHLVRVTHDGANYFSPLPPGSKTVDIDVYTAAKELENVVISEDVMQIQTSADGASLTVTEHFLVRNDSQPQRTLFSDHPFELYLPAGAVVDGAAAKAPGGMAVEQPLKPMGDPNHFTLVFPIRPGDTEFNVWYKIPYKNSFTFQPRPTLPVEALGIMMPRSMTFKAGTGVDFKSVTEQVGGKAQAYLAQSVKPSQPLSFTVTGKGQLPRDTVAQSNSNAAEPAGATAMVTRTPTPAPAAVSAPRSTRTRSATPGPSTAGGSSSASACYLPAARERCSAFPAGRPRVRRSNPHSLSCPAQPYRYCATNSLPSKPIDSKAA